MSAKLKSGNIKKVLRANEEDREREIRVCVFLATLGITFGKHSHIFLLLSNLLNQVFAPVKRKPTAKLFSSPNIMREMYTHENAHRFLFGCFTRVCL